MKLFRWILAVVLQLVVLRTQLQGLFPWGFLYSPHLELIQFTTYSVAISMR